MDKAEVVFSKLAKLSLKAMTGAVVDTAKATVELPKNIKAVGEGRKILREGRKGIKAMKPGESPDWLSAGVIESAEKGIPAVQRRIAKGLIFPAGAVGTALGTGAYIKKRAK